MDSASRSSFHHIFVMPGTVFSNNSAMNGGAVLFNLTAWSLYLYDVKFSANKAANAGGAVVLWQQNIPFLCSNCHFVGNVAYRGGSVYLRTGNELDWLPDVFDLSSKLGVNFSSCRFISNHAKFEGGAMYINYQNYVNMDAVTFVGNTVQGNEEECT